MTKQVKQDAFDAMWSFLQMGGQKANVPLLKELCGNLQRMMMQKTGGQKKYAKADDISFDDFDTIMNGIVIEAMALWLSGALDNLEVQHDHR